MTNFDYLKKEPKFNTFSDVAIAAEKILYIDPTSCIINCRRAMEFAIKWMYSVDASLSMPYQDNLISLMSTEEFRDIIDDYIDGGPCPEGLHDSILAFLVVCAYKKLRGESNCNFMIHPSVRISHQNAFVGADSMLCQSVSGG